VINTLNAASSRREKEGRESKERAARREKGRRTRIRFWLKVGKSNWAGCEFQEKLEDDLRNRTLSTFRWPTEKRGGGITGFSV